MDKSNFTKIFLIVILLVIVIWLIVWSCNTRIVTNNTTLKDLEIEKYIDANDYKIIIIVPYWKAPQTNIQKLYNHYNRMKHVAGVYVIEPDGGNNSGLSNIIKGPNDLRQRFKILSDHISNIPKYNAVMITDDDILVPNNIIDRMISNVIKNPTELTGIWGRNYKNNKYIIKDNVGYVDAVLTKAFIAERSSYELIAKLVKLTAESYGIPALNCEDLYFNFLWKLFIGKRYSLKDIDRKKIPDIGHTNSASISKKPGHVETRSNIVAKFRNNLNDVYNSMTYTKYKIAIVMWYDKGIADYADIAADINEQFCKANGFTFIKCDKRRMPERKPHWERLPLMLEVLGTNKYDYVMWVDADAAFIHKNNKSNELLKLINLYNKDILLSGDMDGKYKPLINSGVIIMKNTQNSRNILKYWISNECQSNGDKQYSETDWNDQNCIRYSHLVNYDNIHSYSHIIPFGVIQTFDHSYPEHTHALIRHFAGTTGQDAKFKRAKKLKQMY